jgi:hypothetical protein
MNNLNTAQKAKIYDDCLYESDKLQRSISQIKSKYAGNPPEDVMVDVRKMEERIQVLVDTLHRLFI